MITSARASNWTGDVVIDHARAGLPKACLVRMKLFTLDHRLIERVVGELAEPDRERVSEHLHRILLLP